VDSPPERAHVEISGSAPLPDGIRALGGEGSQHRFPERTCVGCRLRAAQGSLVRIVRTPDGGLVTGRSLAGRGAWIHGASRECVSRAMRREVLSRALRAPVSPAAVASLPLLLGGEDSADGSLLEVAGGADGPSMPQGGRDPGERDPGERDPGEMVGQARGVLS